MSDSCCNQASIKNNRWLRIGLGLIGLTIAYNIIEAILSVWFGFKADSIALVGFGFDSIIEVSAAVLLLWRLVVQLNNQDEEIIEKTETMVHRFVGVTFFLLAVYILVDASSVLWQQVPPQETMPGIIIAILSLIIMPLLAWGKIRAGKEIGSKALQSEAKETIACSILSLILLLGLAANAIFDWWWADPVAGLAMIPWLIKEGIAGLKGEGCCG